MQPEPTSFRSVASLAALPAPASASRRPAPSPWPAPGDRLDSFVGRALDALVEGAGIVLHGAGRPTGGNSHVVVSPAGIDVVHVRVAYGRLRIGYSAPQGAGRTLLLDDTDATAALTELDETVDVVRTAMSDALVEIDVRGWLCLGGADWNSEPAGVRLCGYNVVPPAALPELLSVEGAHWAVRSLSVIAGGALGCEPAWDDLARSWATPLPGRQRPLTRSRWPQPRQVA